MTDEHPNTWLDARPPSTDLGDEAMRSRIATRLFDDAPVVVRLGRYEVLRTLGAGGMGIVYAARDGRLDRIVAVKLVARARMSERERARLLAEARTMAKLSHPNVVAVYEVGEHEGDVYVAMEFVDGESLAQWQRRDHTIDEVLAVYRQAGAGLAAAHASGIVHRDFKPANVLFGKDGRVRVADFGLAIDAIDPTPTGTGGGSGSSTGSNSKTQTRQAGTPAYMAPEVIDGRRADQHSDQFSFCVSLWESVTGVRPSTKTSMSVNASIVARAEIWSGPRWLEAVLRRGLHPDPSRRWPSVQALVDELERRPRRRRLVTGALALTLTLLGGAGVAGVMLRGPALPEVCVEPSRSFETVWNPAREQALRVGLGQGELASPERSADLIARTYARFGRRWVAARRQQCESLDGLGDGAGDGARAMFDRVDVCLRRSLARADILLARIETAELGAQARITALLAELGDPRRCGALDQMSEVWEPPPELADAVARGYQLLDEVSVALAAGELERADREFDGLRGSDAVREFGPLRAESSVLAGRLAWARDDHDAALDHFVEGAALAEQLGLTRLSFAARRTLAEMYATQLEDLGAARRWFRLAAVPAGELDDPELQRQLALVDAQILTLAGEPAQAEASLRRALEGLAEDDFASQKIKLELANALAVQAKHEAALATYAELEAEWTKLLGPQHPSRGSLDFDIGLALRDLGEIERAQSYLESALAIRSAVYGADSLELAPVLTILADLANSSGDYTRAIELAERAWALQADLPVGHSERGTALMALGWAQIQTGALAGALATHEQLAIELDGLLDPLNRAFLHQNIGWLRCRVDACAGARTHFERALADGDELTKLQARLGLANVELVEGRPQVAVGRIEALLPLLEPWPRSEAPEALALARWMLARALVDAGVEPGSERVRELVRAASDAYVQLPPRADINADLGLLASLAGE